MSKDILKLEDDLQHILKYTADVWDKLSGKTIFLSGGTGFFGKWLLESFCFANDRLQINAKLIVLSRDPGKFLKHYPQYQRENISFIRGDIRSFEFPTESIDYIIHAANEASASLNLEQPVLMYDTVVAGTKHILELARLKKVASFLYTSTGAVYGKQPPDLTHMPENYLGSPDVFSRDAALGESKRVAEMLCNIYYHFYGINTKIARCFAFSGPHLPLDSHFAIGNFIRDVIAGNKITIEGDGTAFRSYMYASDLVIWLWNILIFGKSSWPYNVGSDDDVTIEQLALAVASCSNTKTEIEIMTPKSNALAARYVPDIKRGKDELNLEVRITLNEGIKKTIDFYS